MKNQHYNNERQERGGYRGNRGFGSGRGGRGGFNRNDEKRDEETFGVISKDFQFNHEREPYKGKRGGGGRGDGGRPRPPNDYNKEQKTLSYKPKNEQIAQ